MSLHINDSGTLGEMIADCQFGHCHINMSLFNQADMARKIQHVTKCLVTSEKNLEQINAEKNVRWSYS